MIWDVIGNIADLLSIVSAFITVMSAIVIKKYSNKIVNQFSIEKLILAENRIHDSIDKSQQLKKLYLNASRGLGSNKISQLYLEIEGNLNEISFALPSSYNKIIECITEAKKNITLATSETFIMKKSSYFEELDASLNSISLMLKEEKEKIQQTNIKK